MHQSPIRWILASIFILFFSVLHAQWWIEWMLMSISEIELMIRAIFFKLFHCKFVLEDGKCEIERVNFRCVVVLRLKFLNLASNLSTLDSLFPIGALDSVSLGAICNPVRFGLRPKRIFYGTLPHTLHPCSILTL